MKLKSLKGIDPKTRFSMRHIKDSSGCWLWQGYLTGGYGYITVNGKSILAHRYSYELHNGAIPEGSGYHGTCVCHRCDVRNCVNPNHLFLGSNLENMKDRDRKGRQWRGETRSLANRGERNPQAKLLPHQVQAIRSDKRKLKDIADDFALGVATVSQIRSRKLWKHI